MTEYYELKYEDFSEAPDSIHINKVKTEVTVL